MKIKFADNPDYKTIPIIRKRLLENKILITDIINQVDILKLNTKQFIFFIGLISFEGKNFKQNLKFIHTYIHSKKLNENLDLILSLENDLHILFLKKYENEEAYNQYYNFFSSLYFKKREIKKINSDDKIKNKILFFVHQPSMLAHTIPLFNMIKLRKVDKIVVSIASLNSNDEFTEKCNDLGINFYSLEGKTISEKLSELNNLSKNYDHIIWVSLPIFLSYFKTICSKITFWSHKFHPNISNLNNYIGTFNKDEVKILFNKNIWKNFMNSFEIKNLRNKNENWNIRKNKFGSFCREELIDDKRFWKIIKIITSYNINFIFYYCGRNEIHKKWCKTLNININQIFFLGWLKDPEIKLREMSFLIDGYNLGHGYLALEAMAAKIPIIFPKNKKSYGNVENYLIRTEKIFNPKKDPDYLNRYSLVYTSSDVLDLAKKLITNKKFNEFYGNHYRKVVENHPDHDFDYFCELIYSI